MGNARPSTHGSNLDSNSGEMESRDQMDVFECVLISTDVDRIAPCVEVRPTRMTCFQSRVWHQSRFGPPLVWETIRPSIAHCHGCQDPNPRGVSEDSTMFDLKARRATMGVDQRTCLSSHSKRPHAFIQGAFLKAEDCLGHDKGTRNWSRPSITKHRDLRC